MWTSGLSPTCPVRVVETHAGCTAPTGSVAPQPVSFFRGGQISLIKSTQKPKHIVAVRIGAYGYKIFE